MIGFAVFLRGVESGAPGPAIAPGPGIAQGPVLTSRRRRMIVREMRTPHAVGAVLTLLAMILSLAGTVWASTCAPMAAGTFATSAVHAAPPESECPARTQAQSGHPGEGAHCPFSPVVGHDCTAAASIAAQPSLAPPPSLELALAESAPGQELNALIGAAPFRPPRA